MIVVGFSQAFASYLNLRTIHSMFVTLKTAASNYRFRYFNIMYNITKKARDLHLNLAHLFWRPFPGSLYSKESFCAPDVHILIYRYVYWQLRLPVVQDTWQG